MIVKHLISTVTVMTIFAVVAQASGIPKDQAEVLEQAEQALEKGEYNWPFFRWRYKTMLRKRFRDEPSRFHAILSASKGNTPLTLTCHCPGQYCQGQTCHASLAREFLENLREQLPAEPHPQHESPRSISPAREVSPRRQPRVEVAMLIEHPNQASPVHS